MLQLKDFEKIVTEMHEAQEELKETFACVFDKLDTKMANQIRLKGVPKTMIVGEDLYDLFEKYFSQYCAVTKALPGLLDRNTVFISWTDFNTWNPTTI